MNPKDYDEVRDFIGKHESTVALVIAGWMAKRMNDDWPEIKSLVNVLATQMRHDTIANVVNRVETMKDEP